MSEEKGLLDYISEITELNELHEFMNDPVIDDAMGFLVKFSVKPDVPASMVPALIVRIQALAGICAMKQKYYMTLSKDGRRKGVYFTVEAALNALVNALKYSAK